MLQEEPLGQVEARQLIRRILSSPDGQVVFARSALGERIPERGITDDEVCRGLRRDHIGHDIAFDRGTWRYLIETASLTALVVFDIETMAIVTTTWTRR